MIKRIVPVIALFFVFSSSAEDRGHPIPVVKYAPAPSATPTPAAFGALATATPTKGDGTDNGFLQFNRTPGRDTDTIRLIDAQNNTYDTGNQDVINQQKNIDAGSSRAQQMVNMLKDEQMKKAMEKVTGLGNQMLKENKALHTPAAIIAGAASLWYGRTIKLIKGDNFNMASNFEGKTRSAGFTMDSPLLNGKLRFSQSDGVDLSVNRKIASIGSQAEMKYNTKNQALTTQLKQNLFPHVDLTFGSQISPLSAQPDNRAGIEYKFSF